MLPTVRPSVVPTGHSSAVPTKDSSTDEEKCCKPSDQPSDAARREECSGLDEKSLTTFVSL